MDSEAAREAIHTGAVERHEAPLRDLLVRSAAAPGPMSAVRVALGPLMAGRMLRPVRTMTERARRLSERNLHERLAVIFPPPPADPPGATDSRGRVPHHPCGFGRVR